MLRFLHFLSILTFYIEFSTCSQGLISHEAIANNIFSVLHERFMVGLILVSFREGEDISPAQINLLREVQFPYALIDMKSNKDPSKFPKISFLEKRAVVYRYNKPYFVHTNAPLPQTSWKSSGDRSWHRWTKMYAQLLGQAYTVGLKKNLFETNENVYSSFDSSSLVERLLFKDFFVNIQIQRPVLTRSAQTIATFKYLAIIPLNSLWLIFMSEESSSMEQINNCIFKQSTEIRNFQASMSIGKSKHVVPVCRRLSLSLIESITIVCPFCSIRESLSRVYNQTRSLTKIGDLVIEVAKRNPSAKIELLAPFNSSILIKKYGDIESNVPNISRNVVTSTRSIFHNPLVFISRKSPSSDAVSVINPFTLASWIGIVMAYAVTTIAFGILKAITMNNFDQSLYEYVMEQLLKVINEDRRTRKKIVFKRTGTDEAIYIKRPFESNTSLDPDRKIKGDNNNNEDDDANPENHHGKASKAILHGTIRIVSFVMIATYEGKLYNSITFPKSRLVSTFEDLLTSETYTVKVTKEAEQNGLAGLQFDRFMMKNDSEFENRSKLIRESAPAPTSRIVDSVNIDDCINWVESTSDPNHACIGYEFELRNLHKSQRFDKWVAKSNKKLGKHGYGRGRRGSRLFPGAFQISKWIMESGIMQLWNIAESSFTESITQDSSSQSNVFTIRDYLGLFTIFFILILLALIVFLSEVGAGWAEERLNLHSIKDYWQFVGRGFDQIPRFLVAPFKKLTSYNFRFSKRKRGRVSNC